LEIELKLLVAPEDLTNLPQHPALQALQRTEPHIEQLHTLYYDTAARDLARAGIALRVRRSGTQWIQTLKAGGRSAGGLHERVELEWPLADAALDLTRLADTPYADLFADEQMSGGLAPVFETEFERTAIVLGFADGTTAELALDRGVVRAGAHSEPISEIEIELLSGSAQPLFDLALALSQNISLRLGYLSKAERGDALATGRVRLPRKASPVVLDSAWTAIQALRHIVLGCIAHMQSNEQGVLDAGDAEYLHQLRVGLRRLRSCIGLFRFVAPKGSYAGLVD
jgi:inorganic triphosphatase YgiF